MALYESVLGLIGETPLVEISALSPNPDARLYIKLEGQNPGGSVKDRVALSMIEIAPCFVTFCVGENVTLIEHFAPAATLAPHVDVTPNSLLAFIDAILSALLPVFVRLTVCGGLMVPTACFLKFSGVVGEKLTTPVFSRTVM